ncbi:MAG: type II toxin-antitoxin system VapC family toxin [Sphingomonadaceae bacterium]
MSDVVLDASAVIALLRGEPGADIVKAALKQAHLGVINLGEVAQCLFRDGWSRAEIEETIEALDVRVRAVRIDLVIAAAEIREVGRKYGLSQADCLCLALARREAAVILTADRVWLQVAEAVGVEVKLIR